MKRYYIIFEGRVQNVGFRWTVMTIAQSLHCTGWIRNMMNGNVDMEIQGNFDLIGFIEKLRDSSRWIRIDDYSIMEIPIKPEEKRFSVRN